MGDMRRFCHGMIAGLVVRAVSEWFGWTTEIAQQQPFASACEIMLVFGALSVLWFGRKG